MQRKNSKAIDPSISNIIYCALGFYNIMTFRIEVTWYNTCFVLHRVRYYCDL